MTPWTRQTGSSRLTAALVVLLTASAASAQTRFEPHDNSYSPEQDVQLGREAAAEIRRELPLLDDERTDDFIDRIGDQLIAEIPGEFRQPAFRYSFDVVNLREINAFALPGGPMFVHRGMIEAARSEGEVAGVMAHELAHVILRHGTAQASKGQKWQLGALAGQVLGSILGGRTGAIVAQGSEIGAGLGLLKYSREFEREADLFGAQLMARAGYDPRQMASMFETIQRQSGSRGPEWLNSHPDPGNRAQAIVREAEMLRVEGSTGSNADLQAVHARLKGMSPAPSMAQLSRQQENGRTSPAGGRRSARVEPPSAEWRTHQPGDLLRLRIPANWQPMDAGGTVRYAPAGGVVRGPGGGTAFTHGIEVGVTEAEGSNLQQRTEALLRGFAQANPQLRRSGGYSRTAIGGRQGLTTTLTNVSEVTGEKEAVNVSTVPLQDGRLLFLVGVAPASEARTYLNTFSRVRQSIQLADAGR